MQESYRLFSVNCLALTNALVWAVNVAHLQLPMHDGWYDCQSLHYAKYETQMPKYRNPLK